MWSLATSALQPSALLGNISAASGFLNAWCLDRRFPYALCGIQISTAMIHQSIVTQANNGTSRYITRWFLVTLKKMS
jgi:hypothetical protein